MDQVTCGDYGDVNPTTTADKDPSMLSVLIRLQYFEEGLTINSHIEEWISTEIETHNNLLISIWPAFASKDSRLVT